MLKRGGKDDKMLNNIMGELYEFKIIGQKKNSDIIRKGSMALKSLKDNKEIRILQVNKGNGAIVWNVFLMLLFIR
jgi:hypothetical protein